MKVIAWDRVNNLPIAPGRDPVDGEWAKFDSDGFVEYKHFYALSDPQSPIDIFTTGGEVVTINGNPAAGFQSVYFGVNGDSANMTFNIVDDQGALQSQIDSATLGYPPILALPVLKVANGSNDNVVDEVYFSTTIVGGVVTVAGSFPASGNWKLLTERINAALAEIGAHWAIEKDDVTFRINS